MGSLVVTVTRILTSVPVTNNVVTNMPTVPILLVPSSARVMPVLPSSTPLCVKVHQHLIYIL